jgi:hypothetical protein
VILTPALVLVGGMGLIALLLHVPHHVHKELVWTSTLVNVILGGLIVLAHLLYVLEVCCAIILKLALDLIRAFVWVAG